MMMKSKNSGGSFRVVDDGQRLLADLATFRRVFLLRALRQRFVL